MFTNKQTNKQTNKLAKALAALALAFTFSEAAHASLVNWTMSEATFNYTIKGGRTSPNINVAEKVSGSFTYDADSNTFSNLNFVSSELFRHDATPATAPADLFETSTSSYFAFYFNQAGNARLSMIIYRAYLNSPLTNAGGIIDGTLRVSGISTCAVGGCDQLSNIKLTGTPQVSAVPVPAAAWLFGSSLLGLVGLRRKKQA